MPVDGATTVRARHSNQSYPTGQGAHAGCVKDVQQLGRRSPTDTSPAASQAGQDAGTGERQDGNRAAWTYVRDERPWAGEAPVRRCPLPLVANSSIAAASRASWRSCSLLLGAVLAAPRAEEVALRPIAVRAPAAAALGDQRRSSSAATGGLAVEAGLATSGLLPVGL